MCSPVMPWTQRVCPGDPAQQSRPLALECWRKSMHAALMLQRLASASLAGCNDTSRAAPAAAGLRSPPSLSVASAIAAESMPAASAWPSLAFGRLLPSQSGLKPESR